MPPSVKENPSVQIVQIKHANRYRTVVYFFLELCILEKRRTQHYCLRGAPHRGHLICVQTLHVQRRPSVQMMLGDLEKRERANVSHLAVLSVALSFYALT